MTGAFGRRCRNLDDFQDGAGTVAQAAVAAAAVRAYGKAEGTPSLTAGV